MGFRQALQVIPKVTIHMCKSVPFQDLFTKIITSKATKNNIVNAFVNIINTVFFTRELYFLLLLFSKTLRKDSFTETTEILYKYVTNIKAITSINRNK